MSIAVFGLGKLGLPLASLLAEQHKVIGCDINHKLISQLGQRTYHHFEPCMYTNIHTFTPSIQAAVELSDIGILCVNTPTNIDGTMDLSQVLGCCTEIANHVGNRDYLLVICSTVMPGTANNLRKILPQQVQIFSNPIWIAMGSVVENLRKPPAMVIGGKQGSTPFPIVDLWSKVANFNTPILTDNYTAEFIKLAHNTWCCIKMSFIGQIGDTNPKVDIECLSNFFSNGGERPGAFWKYGPSFSGPCFPRDLDFWLQHQQDLIGLAANSENISRPYRLVDQIPEGSQVLLIGDSYKSGMHIYEDSLAERMTTLLEKRKCKVKIENPDSGFIPKGMDFVFLLYPNILKGPYQRENPQAKVVHLWNSKDVQQFINVQDQ
jgi:nucleotide sugar dehydrogenase